MGSRRGGRKGAQKCAIKEAEKAEESLRWFAMVCGCWRWFAVVEEPEGWPQRDAKMSKKRGGDEEVEMKGR